MPEHLPVHLLGEMGGGEHHRVKSNNSASKMKLYSGIAIGGVVAGSAIVASRSPIYDDQKRARGIDVKRNVKFNKDYTDYNLDGLDKDMYELARQTKDSAGAPKAINHAEVVKYESQARRNFHGKSAEQQAGLEKIMTTDPFELGKGSFTERMLSKARRAVQKVSKL